jgi:hypothetical protein
MTVPKIKFDWTFNIGHVISMLVFIMAGIGAYYDVKTDLRVLATKVQAVDIFMTQQKHQDETQDLQRERVVTELKDSLRDSKNDIKQDIRDLRNDLFRKKN